MPGVNQFTIPTLAGMGAGAFGLTDSEAPHFAYVFRDAGGTGAAPQGETQYVISYDSTTGVFTTNPFTTSVGVGDEIIIFNPMFAYIEEIYDNLDNLVDFISTFPVSNATNSGTISHASSTSETDALILSPATTIEFRELFLDMSNLTQITTVRLYIKVDGIDYRLLDEVEYPTDFGNRKAIRLDLFTSHRDWKITLQSAVAEGSSKNVPYSYSQKDTP